MRGIRGLCLEFDVSARQIHVAIMKREAKTQKVSRAFPVAIRPSQLVHKHLFIFVTSTMKLVPYRLNFPTITLPHLLRELYSHTSSSKSIFFISMTSQESRYAGASRGPVSFPIRGVCM